MAGCWLGALADAARADGALVAAVAARDGWDERFADRRTELVLIGAGLDRGKAEAALDAALLSEAEAEALQLGAGGGCGREEVFAELVGPALAQLRAGGPRSDVEGEAGGCGVGGWPARSAVEDMLRERLQPAQAEDMAA